MWIKNLKRADFVSKQKQQNMSVFSHSYSSIKHVTLSLRIKRFTTDRKNKHMERLEINTLKRITFTYLATSHLQLGHSTMAKVAASVSG
jgi:hypothetical protein